MTADGKHGSVQEMLPLGSRRDRRAGRSGEQNGGDPRQAQRYGISNAFEAS